MLTKQANMIKEAYMGTIMKSLGKGLLTNKPNFSKGIKGAFKGSTNYLDKGFSADGIATHAKTLANLSKNNMLRTPQGTAAAKALGHAIGRTGVTYGAVATGAGGVGAVYNGLTSNNRQWA